MTTEDREARVVRVLEEMHLTHVAESQIGDARRKGLSGGEKKRLSIAAELIPDPAVKKRKLQFSIFFKKKTKLKIIFLDEPTSG